MSVIFHVTQEDLLQQRKRDLLHIEDKLCKYNLHHELLLNYKKNHKFLKGMQLKFHPSLCNDETTKKLCRQALRKASLGLRDIFLDKVPKKVESLNSEKTDVIRTLKNNIAEDEFLTISRNIKQKVQKSPKEIKSRHARKHGRDNIKFIESACRNRRFRKTKRMRHNRERKTDWLERKLYYQQKQTVLIKMALT